MTRNNDLSERYYGREELLKMGFKSVGENTWISKKASIYNITDSCLGSNVRIDDFAFIMGKLITGNYIHIAPFSNVVAGNAGIYMDDFSGVSARVSIYATSDDYSGEAMTNPMVPEKYTNVMNSEVHICRHAIIGVNSVILPGVLVGEGASVGAMSLVNKNIEPWSINVGIPCKKIADRSKKLLECEKEFLHEIANTN